MTGLPLDLPPVVRASPVSAAAVIARGIGDPAVRDRYVAKVAGYGGDPDACWWWTGALHAHRGHGRFWVGTYPDHHGRRRDVAIIAHRYGWALVYGVQALAEAQVLAHACDEPSCQNPAHLMVATQDTNRADFLARRWQARSPLRDVRGPAGRARAIRHALLTGGDLDAVLAAGVSTLDRHQVLLPAFQDAP